MASIPYRQQKKSITPSNRQPNPLLRDPRPTAHRHLLHFPLSATPHLHHLCHLTVCPPPAALPTWAPSSTKSPGASLSRLSCEKLILPPKPIRIPPCALAPPSPLAPSARTPHLLGENPPSPARNPNLKVCGRRGLLKRNWKATNG